MSSENGLKVVRPQLLPVMKALLKVMETNKPEPKDVNKLLVLTRELMDLIPDGGDFALPSLKQYGFDVDSIEGFGLDGIKKIGLSNTGDIIVMKSNRPYVVTQWGKGILFQETVHCKYIRPDYDGTLAIHRSTIVVRSTMNG